MNFKPILFSTPMVQAILDGRKTMTRRIIKIDDLNGSPERFKYLGYSTNMDVPRQARPFDEHVYHAWTLQNNNEPLWVDTAGYEKGDIMWVRETFSPLVTGGPSNFNLYAYRADGTEIDGKWKPSLFMPKDACRIFLKVTGVKVERLQDISEADAISEGIEWHPCPIDKRPRYKDYLVSGDTLGVAKTSFNTLWQSIHGPDSWNANPWVWAYSFEPIKKPKNFLL